MNEQSSLRHYIVNDWDHADPSAFAKRAARNLRDAGKKGEAMMSHGVWMVQTDIPEKEWKALVRTIEKEMDKETYGKKK